MIRAEPAGFDLLKRKASSKYPLWAKVPPIVNALRVRKIVRNLMSS